MKCSMCSWESIPNATRLAQHWEKHHGIKDEATKSKSEPAVECAPKAKITTHLNHAYTKTEQERAQKRLVFAAINNGWSHNSLKHPLFELFCRALRYASLASTPLTP